MPRNAYLPVLILVIIGHAWVSLPNAQAKEPMTEVLFKRIAVAPFLISRRQPNMDESLDDTLSCPLKKICADDPSIQSNAGAMLFRFVHDVLKNRFARYVVPLDQVQEAYDGLKLDSTKDSPRTMALRMGQSLSADLLVVGTVWRYRDRGAIQGFPDKPASVAFAIYVVEPQSGRQLWRGIYNDAQEIALKDLANFTKRIKMGIKWLSADELARHGVKEVFRPFPSNIRPDPMTVPNVGGMK